MIVNTPKQTTCGSCYNAGSADDCCNTCEELIAKYRAKGLNLHGILAFAPVVSFSWTCQCSVPITTS